ncbi:MAG: ubiquinol-cytochrome c reductase iron-sulfur subunit [Chloroflexota bacterium]
MSRPSRRDFMKVITGYLLGLSGALGIAGVARYLTFESEPRRPTEYDLGLASDFALDTRTPVNEVPALLIRNQGGFVAVSLLCTHLGCTVEESPDGFVCPCHGSRYDVRGTVQRGPATEPLRQLRTEVTADARLVLHTE